MKSGSFLILALLPAVAAAAPPRVLSLEDALRLAQAHQPQLRAARAQARAGAARVGEAVAGYLPRLDGTAQLQRATANFALSPSFTTSPFANQLRVQNRLGFGATVSYYLYGVTLTQLIYDFGRTGGAVAQARAAADTSRADLDTTLAAVALNVRLAYFQVLAARELVRVGEDTVANQARHVRQIREFVRVGTRARIDLTSAELNLANAELSLVQARNSVNLAKVNLLQAVGLEGGLDFDVVAPPASPAPEESGRLGDLVQEAVRRRPELARAAAQIRLQQGGRRAALSGYLPALVGYGSFSGSKVDRFDSTYNWYVALGLTWNLFGGLFTRRQVEEAEAGIEAAEAQREATRLAVRQEIETQLLAIGEARQRQVVAERAVASAQERLRLAEGRYRTGVGDIIELDDAQVTQANALAQRVQAEYDLATARARLRRAIGPQ
ncbi:MAG TPA: TolC family protein [Polyangia bacterium]|jgi:outer membrane protein